MTATCCDSPGATFPVVTSKLNSDPNKGTPPDNRDREKDAATYSTCAQDKWREEINLLKTTVHVLYRRILMHTHRRGIEDVEPFLQTLPDSNRTKVKHRTAIFILLFWVCVSQLKIWVFG